MDYLYPQVETGTGTGYRKRNIILYPTVKKVLNSDYQHEIGISSIFFYVFHNCEKTGYGKIQQQHKQIRTTLRSDFDTPNGRTKIHLYSIEN
jgi:hypothetical protein